MTGTFDLWLAILLAAVIVFIASALMHMVLPHHRKDYAKLPGEDAVLGSMREQGLKPGEYGFPWPDSMKEMCSPEMMEKYKQGPVGFMVVLPNGPPAMGKSLVQWFLYTILVGIFVAYVAGRSFAPGADYMAVFRLTGTVAILVYAVGQIPASIWKGQSWCSTVKFVFDGAVYGLLTAGVFGWLWPGAGA